MRINFRNAQCVLVFVENIHVEEASQCENSWSGLASSDYTLYGGVW